MKKFFSKVKDKFSVHFISSFKKEKKKKEKRKLNRREKILKYTAIVLLPTLAIASCVVLGFREFNAKKGGGTTNQVVITTNGIKRKIFLVSEDNYTVPITVTLDQRTTLQQEILDVFDLLKTSSKANSTYVSGFINDNTKITSFNLSNKVLELNLSEEFLDSKYNDVNVIEALTLTFLQFDEIDELRQRRTASVFSGLRIRHQSGDRQHSRHQGKRECDCLCPKELRQQYGISDSRFGLCRKGKKQEHHFRQCRKEELYFRIASKKSGSV